MKFHNNCTGCHHIREDRCLYRTAPAEHRNWPCYFRKAITKEQADDTAAYFEEKKKNDKVSPAAMPPDDSSPG